MIARTFNLYNLLRTTFYDLPFGCGGWHSSRKSQWKKYCLNNLILVYTESISLWLALFLCNIYFSFIDFDIPIQRLNFLPELCNLYGCQKANLIKGGKENE